MSQPILLMNPGRSGRRHKKRGRRKMSALQRAYFGKGRRHNPKRRTRGHSRRSAVAYVKHHRRRNPGTYMVPMKQQLVDSTVGAGGALALDIVAAKLNGYLPATFQSGYAMYGFKAVLALALGFVAEKVIKKRTAVMIAEGGLIMVIHDAAKGALATAMPSLGLGEYVVTQAAPPTRMQPGLGWQGNAQLVHQPPPGGIGGYIEEPGSYASLVNAASSQGTG